MSSIKDLTNQLAKAFILEGKELTFDEAVKFFADKMPINLDDFIRIQDEYKAMAFTVSGYSSVKVIEKFQEELTSAIASGQTLKTFKTNMNDFLLRKGYDPITPFEADNIFRTNVQTAYNVGHYEQMSDPDVLKARPFWIYDAVNDSHTRPTHLGMDGRVFPADHPVWDTWYPPNGFRCRCIVRSMSKSQVERKGLSVESEVPAMVPRITMGANGEKYTGAPIPLKPDRYFDQNPAKQPWKPDPSKLPENLREFYKTKFETPNET
jgi:SPP1 gp7 family putative phage head morphogenesis protein